MKLKILSIIDSEKVLSDYLAALGDFFSIEGVWEKENSWDIYLPCRTDSKVIDEIVTFLENFYKGCLEYNISDYDDENIDWNAEWKKGFEPVDITDRVTVYPAWIPVPDENNKIFVRIDPQMGFGTGTHETTQLMMELIEKYSNEQQNILDAGTGSGILSVLSEKINLNAEIVAFDVDPDAIANAQINQKLNECNHIEWLIGDIEVVPNRKFDLILANINRVILMELIPALFEKLKQDGILILSGILTEEIYLIKNKCSELGLYETELRQKNEWTAGVWKL